MKYKIQIHQPGAQSANDLTTVINLIPLNMVYNNLHSPLISCLMVTRGTPVFVRAAITSFLHQTYINKELIIVSDKNYDSIQTLIQEYDSTSIKLVFIPEVKPLGDLRNIAMREAKGQIISQWDDDDEYHEDRLSIGVAALIQADVAAVFLKRWLICWPENEHLVVSNERAWEGSMIAWKKSVPSYPPIARGEDTVVVDALCKREKFAIIDIPWLYCYYIHGNNSWDSEHMKNMMRERSLDIISMNADLNNVELNEYYTVEQGYADRGDNAISPVQIFKNEKFMKILVEDIESRHIHVKELIARNRMVNIVKIAPKSVAVAFAELLLTVGRFINSKRIENIAVMIWNAHSNG